MSTKRYTVTCHWDEEAEVWYVSETDVPGVATEAATVEKMENKLLRMVPNPVLIQTNRKLLRTPFKTRTRRVSMQWRDQRTTHNA
jgi:hypothetical protein